MARPEKNPPSETLGETQRGESSGRLREKKIVQNNAQDEFQADLRPRGSEKGRAGWKVLAVKQPKGDSPGRIPKGKSAKMMISREIAKGPRKRSQHTNGGGGGKEIIR